MTTTTAAPPRYPANRAGLADALAGLGGTDRHVAAALDAGGYAGQRGEPECCPIAHYLRSVIPTASEISVGTEEASMVTEAGDPVRVDLPAPVIEFVTAFDSGAFSGLDGDDRA